MWAGQRLEGGGGTAIDYKDINEVQEGKVCDEIPLSLGPSLREPIGAFEIFRGHTRGSSPEKFSQEGRKKCPCSRERIGKKTSRKELEQIY